MKDSTIIGFIYSSNIINFSYSSQIPYLDLPAHTPFKISCTIVPLSHFISLNFYPTYFEILPSFIVHFLTFVCPPINGSLSKDSKLASIYERAFFSQSTSPHSEWLFPVQCEFSPLSEEVLELWLLEKGKLAFGGYSPWEDIHVSLDSLTCMRTQVLLSELHRFIKQHMNFRRKNGWAKGRAALTIFSRLPRNYMVRVYLYTLVIRHNR